VRVLQAIDAAVGGGVAITDCTIALVLTVLSALKFDTFLTSQTMIVFGAINAQTVLALIRGAVGVVAVPVAFTTGQAVARDAQLAQFAIVLG